MQNKTEQNKATAANLPVHLSVREAAAYLEISTSSLYGLFRSHALPYVTVGKHRRVLGADLARYLTDGVWTAPGPALGVGVGPELGVGPGEEYPRSEDEDPGPAGAREKPPSRRPRARAPRAEFIPPTI